MQHDIVKRVDIVAWPGAWVNPKVVELCPLVVCVAASECDWTWGPSLNDPGRIDGSRLQGV